MHELIGFYFLFFENHSEHKPEAAVWYIARRIGQRDWSRLVARARMLRSRVDATFGRRGLVSSAGIEFKIKEAAHTVQLERRSQTAACRAVDATSTRSTFSGRMLEIVSA